MNRIKISHASILALILALVALPALAGPAADSQQTGTAISWQPNIAFSNAKLVISAPNGEIFEKSFAAGSAPSWSVFDSNGYAWPDGSYTYELRLTPTGTSLERGAGDAYSLAGDSRENWDRTVDYGYFTIADGQLVAQTLEAEGSEDKIDFDAPKVSVDPKDQQILDDLIVGGSICVGQDCVNGESFGFDTIRLKENNLRIKFQDTSNSASFPSRDWQITANDTSNGGKNKYSIDDIDGGRTPYTIEAGAPSNSLYVEDGGRIGFGTATPVVDLHVVSGNTPTLRLEQDGSNGFTAQTWDLAGNEANFFLRDATNGSKLPIQVKPNAPTASIFIEDGTGDIGLSTASPSQPLHVRRTNGTSGVFIEETQAGTQTLLRLENPGRTSIAIDDTTNNVEWAISNVGAIGQLYLTAAGTMQNEMILTTAGDMTITGDYFSTACTTPCAPDYVFEDDYELMPLNEVESFIAENKHLPNVPSAEELVGPINMTEMQMTLLEKVEELMLYTLQQKNTITELEARLAALEQTETVD